MIELDDSLPLELKEGIISQKEKLIVREYQKALNEIKDKLARAYAEYGKNNVLTISAMKKYGRMEKLEQKIIKEANKLLKNTSKHIKAGNRGIFQTVYRANEYFLSEKTTGGFTFTLLDDKAVEEAVKSDYSKIKWPERLQGHIEEAQQRVRTEITQNIIQGEPYKETSKKLAKHLGVAASKSNRIVRTEAHRVQELAHSRSRDEIARNLQKKKSQVYKIWDATFDLNTRPTHAKLDGQKVPKNKDFTVQGMTAPVPGQFGIARMDINCRCYTRTVIENENFQFQEPQRTYSDFVREKTGKQTAYNTRMEPDFGESNIQYWNKNDIAQQMSKTKYTQQYMNYQKQFSKQLEG